MIKGTIRFLIASLGAYFAMVLTSISLLLVVSIFLIDERIIETSKLLSYLIIPIILLLLYSVLTTKTNNTSTIFRFRQIIKRFIDLVISSLGIFFTAPLIIVIAIAIKLDSPGPVFYRFRRIGQFGKPIDVFRFRTMNIAPTQIPITRVGKLLRRYALDELPMFYNVIEGELSLVGPLPRRPDNQDDSLDSEKLILTVRPGITGLWQISASSKSDLHQLIVLDLEYIKKWAILLDIKILFKTILIVLRGEK